MPCWAASIANCCKVASLSSLWLAGGEPMGIYAVHPSTRHVPLEVRAFVDFLSEQHGGRKGWA